MTQRFAFATAAGLAAFVVVILGALGAYIALGGPVDPAGSSVAQIAAAPPQAAAQPPAAEHEESDDEAPTTVYPISADDAATIALNSVPGATLAQPPRLVQVNGTVAYEVALDRGAVYVDAGSGQVLYNTAAGANPRGGRRSRGSR
jgi:hypothetical protein